MGRPNVGSRERFLDRVDAALEARWFTNDGPLVREFEAAVADTHGVRHCVATCNGTSALQIAIRATGLTGEVILPAFTFVATAHALQWQGLSPVFCDIDPATHNIDAEKIQALITERTTGVIGVHLWGRACDAEALTRITERNELALLFDAAHAFGCSRGGRMIGSFGVAEVLSFHATKFVQAFEGGAVLTNDDDLADRARLMRNFGFADYDSVVHVGTNAKMTEICAAMGTTCIESCNDFMATNRRNHASYAAGLRGIPGVGLQHYDERDRCNWQYVVVEIDHAEAGLTRDELQKVLWSENILARRYFWPGCHRMSPYAETPPDGGWVLPETERVAGRILTLPTGTTVSSSDIAVVCDVIRSAVDGEAPRARPTG